MQNRRAVQSSFCCAHSSSLPGIAPPAPPPPLQSYGNRLLHVCSRCESDRCKNRLLKSSKRKTFRSKLYSGVGGVAEQVSEGASLSRSLSPTLRVSSPGNQATAVQVRPLRNRAHVPPRSFLLLVRNALKACLGPSPHAPMIVGLLVSALSHALRTTCSAISP